MTQRNIRPTVVLAVLLSATFAATSAMAAQSNPGDSPRSCQTPSPSTVKSAAYAGTGVATVALAADMKACSIEVLSAPAARSTATWLARTNFHPDYSHALTPQQMTAAWNAEIARIMQLPPPTP